VQGKTRGPNNGSPFAAWEQPELFAAESRAAFQSFPANSDKETSMNVLRLMCAGVIVCLVTVGVGAEDKKDNANLVIGRWEVVKASPKTFPLGTVIDMSGDNKVKVIGKRDGKEFVHAGTYKVDGAKIIFTVSVEGEEQKHVLTITKISDTDMATDHLGGGTIEFKKEK
jgi:uncharacterized protein (TIGR03066 family)